MDIIKACGEAGVAKFSDGRMTIEFFPPERVAQNPGIEPKGFLAPEGESIRMIGEDVGLDHGENSQDEAYVSPELKEEMRLSDLMVNDPAAYEQEMIDFFKREE